MRAALRQREDRPPRSRLLIAGLAAVWLLLPHGSWAAELSARAWVEPESPRLGETAALVLQTDLVAESRVLAVGQVRFELPEVPELGLGPSSFTLSQRTQTILSGGQSTVRSEQRIALRPTRAGRCEIPAIGVTAQIGQGVLTGRTAPVFVEVGASATGGPGRAPGDPQGVGDRMPGRLALVLIAALVGLAVLSVVVWRLARRSSPSGPKADPSADPSADPPGDDLVGRLRALATEGSSVAMMDACLGHLRSLVGDEARAMTRTEMEAAMGGRLSRAGAARLRDLLDAAEAVTFAGAQLDAAALEKAALDAIAVSRELGGTTLERSRWE